MVSGLVEILRMQTQFVLLVEFRQLIHGVGISTFSIMHCFLLRVSILSLTLSFIDRDIPRPHTIRMTDPALPRRSTTSSPSMDVAGKGVDEHN